MSGAKDYGGDPWDVSFFDSRDPRTSAGIESASNSCSCPSTLDSIGSVPSTESCESYPTTLSDCSSCPASVIESSAVVYINSLRCLDIGNVKTPDVCAFHHRQVAYAAPRTRRRNRHPLT